MKRLNCKIFYTIFIIYFIGYGFIDYFIKDKPKDYFSIQTLVILIAKTTLIALVFAYFIQPKKQKIND